MATSSPLRGFTSILSQSSKRQSSLCRPCLRLQQLSSNPNAQHVQTQIRSLHRHVRAAPIPPPTPFVPDVSTFLKLIGRNLSVHAAKFTSWESLFKLSSTQLKELAIEPPRTRRYLLRWREKFRRGEYGIGGDFKFVSDGVGELRVVEVPSLPSAEQDNSTSTSTPTSTNRTPGSTKLIVNVPTGAQTYTLEAGQTTQDLKKPSFVTLRDGHAIVGSYLQPVKGTNGTAAVLKVVEGMWEDRRGHKVHGGERRRAETLHKLRVAERKKNER